MTDWLDTCRLCVADIRGVLERLPTRAEREPVLRRGEGGDETTAIDQAAEDAVVARLEALGEDFVLVSEELGKRAFGAGGRARRRRSDRRLREREARDPVLLVLARGRRGPTMGDVTFGYVYDFGTGEEWTAERGGGAFLGGEHARCRCGRRRRSRSSRSRARRAAIIADRIGGVLELVGRVRVMGSLALSLCHLAGGRVDAVCSLKPARSVDIAAAQLLVRECGLAIELFEDPPFERAPLDLAMRSRVAAAGSAELVAKLAAALALTRWYPRLGEA